MKRRASCGLLWTAIPDISSALRVATSSGYDFIAAPIVNPRYRQAETISEASTLPREPTANGGDAPSEPKKTCQRGYAFTRSDLLLNSGDWGSLVVGIVSRDLNMESSNQQIRRTSEERLRRELMFSAHLGLSAILVPLTKPSNINLSRFIYSHLSKGGPIGSQVWLRIPLSVRPSLANPDAAPQDTWLWWDSFRSAANSDRRLNIALDVTSAEMPDEAALKRWLGEPVKCLIISTKVFLTNKRGYPVLPRSLQSMMKMFASLDVRCIIEGRNMGHDMRHYQQYMDHLWQQFESADPVRQYARGYEDYLQSPLQPLMDNLESGTYEVFEKDPIKYTEYQRAIYQAILDRVPEEEKDTKTPTVVVLGAGRGPLVRAALKAADMANRKIRVFAVEKNPNAIVTLLTQKHEDWGGKVEVISSDMRHWHPKPEDRADIVISELLGSFGDNELSPECLYSAQHVFKPDAISIPSSYTSFVSPLQSSKLYNEVRNSYDRDKNPHANFETPYVVHLQNRTELDKPQPLFSFVHPLAGEIDNTRYKSLTFSISQDSELHGFAGYFECTLYKDVMISINPETHSKGMFSWFPIFFPLNTPVRLFKGNPVELHFWRLNDSKQVWYEWCITKPVPVPIHNPNGRSYTIGL